MNWTEYRMWFAPRGYKLLFSGIEEGYRRYLVLSPTNVLCGQVYAPKI